MNRLKDLEEIRKILFDYCPEKTKYDLEQWVLSILLNTYIGVNFKDVDTLTFKFNNTNIMYLTECNVFNLLKVSEKNKVLDCSLMLSSFLKENYGLATLQDVDKLLLLSDDDFDLMASQLAQQIIDWDENVVLLGDKEIKPCHKMGA